MCIVEMCTSDDDAVSIARFLYIKIQPERINITARLRGINPYKLFNLFPEASK